ncbi:MAG: alpha/beta hydrolase [Acidobacteriota bacterium]
MPDLPPSSDESDSPDGYVVPHETLRLAVAGIDGAGEEYLSAVYSPARGKTETAVLYLHGFGSSQLGEKAIFFRYLFDAIGWPFLSLDFRGHGDSDGEMEGLTLSRCVEDAEAGLRELWRRGARRVLLFGSSMGGRVALELAARGVAGVGEPEVKALVAIAPAVDMLERTEARAGAEGLAHWQSAGAVEVVTEVVSCSLGWGWVEDLRRRDVEGLASRLAVPSLFFQGKLDDTVSWQAVDRFAKAAKGLITLDLFPDGDHRLLNHKETLAERTVEFLTSCEGLGASPESQGN